MNQIGGSRTDTLVKLVLIFFISLFSFSVGTYVGKSVTEKQYQNTMYDPTGEEAVEQASHDEEASKDAVDEDSLSLSEEFANLKKEGPSDRKVASEEHKDATKKEDPHAASPAHAESAHASPAHAAKPAAKMDAAAAKPTTHGTDSHGKVMEAAQRVAVGKPPTEAPAPTTPKASTLPSEVASTTVGKWTLQIASYPKEDEAQKHAEDLKTKGFSAFYIPAQVKGATWYRVSVGLFPTMSGANEYKEEFIKKSSVSKVIVQKITQ